MGQMLGPDGCCRPLPAEALIGRDTRCDLLDTGIGVSLHHARLRWRGDHWELKDLHSENGTWLDGVRVGTGWVSLAAAARISLDGGPGWTLVDATAPRAFAARAGQFVQVDDHDRIVLPEAVLRETVERGWVIEGDLGEHTMAADRQVAGWRVELPEAHPPTVHLGRGFDLDRLTLHFLVARSEEHVALEVVQDDRRVRLARREPFWILLLLARDRLADRVGPEHDRGWVPIDTLARQTRWERTRLDVYTLRARRALRDAGVVGAEGMVEARPNERRLSLPPERIVLGRL